MDQSLLQAPQLSPDTGGATGDESKADKLPVAEGKAFENIKAPITKAIYDLLKNLEEKTAKVEAVQEVQSDVLERVHQLLESHDIHGWGRIINYDEDTPTLGSLFDPLFEVGPEMVKNQEDFLEQMRQVHLAQTKQRVSFSLMNKVDSIDREQLEPLNNILELMNDVHEIRVEQHKALDEKLDHVHDDQRHTMNKLGYFYDAQVDQNETLTEQLEEVHDQQMELENTLMEKLDDIDENLLGQESNFLEKLSDMQEEQSEMEKKLMEMLNKIQEQQMDAEASHSKWNVLIYGDQKRTLDWLATLEEKVDAMVVKTLDVSEPGDDSEERAPIELQDHLPQVIQQERNTEQGILVVPMGIPLGQPAELDRGGNLRGLWECFAPLLIVSMLLGAL
jgi:hypothetical protein